MCHESPHIYSIVSHCRYNRVTIAKWRHMDSSILVNFVSGSDMSSFRRRAINWTLFGINFNEILIHFIYFHSRKCIWECRLKNSGHFFLDLNVLNVSLAKCRSFCYGFNVFNDTNFLPSGVTILSGTRVRYPEFSGHEVQCPIQTTVVSGCSGDLIGYTTRVNGAHLGICFLAEFFSHGRTRPVKAFWWQFSPMQESQ